jgi:hypothetical protein
LTAASKMFLLEPFLRLSEEQQAYGRCHRIGQTKPVHVTTYFSPISVESRLLKWRQRAAAQTGRQSSHATTTTHNAVYHNLDDESDDDDDDVTEEQEEEQEENEILNQTRFLLNIRTTNDRTTDNTASGSS